MGQSMNQEALAVLAMNAPNVENDSSLHQPGWSGLRLLEPPAQAAGKLSHQL